MLNINDFTQKELYALFYYIVYASYFKNEHLKKYVNIIDKYEIDGRKIVNSYYKLGFCRIPKEFLDFIFLNKEESIKEQLNNSTNEDMICLHSLSIMFEKLSIAFSGENSGISLRGYLERVNYLKRIMLDKIVIDDIEIPSNYDPSNPTPEFILSFIEYVRKIELSRGLTEEEVIAKYIYGCCWDLAEAIKKMFKDCKWIAEEYREDCRYYFEPNMIRNDGDHCYIRFFTSKEATLLKRGEREISIPDYKSVRYYDILGEHTQMREFAQNFCLNDTQYNVARKKMNGYQMDKTIPMQAAERVMNEYFKRNQVNSNERIR